jgi:spore coat protein H
MIFRKFQSLAQFLLAIAVIVLVSNGIHATTPVDHTIGLLMNGVPCVLDQSYGTMTFSIPPTSAASFKAKFFRNDGVNDSVLVDNMNVSNGDSVTISDWHSDSHIISLGDGNGGRKDWKLQFTTLPIVMIESDGYQYNHDDWKPGRVFIIDALKRTQGVELYSSLAGVHFHGATALGFEKKSYNIELWDTDSVEKDVQVFGMRSDGDWILDAMWVDKSRMRNRVCTDIWNSIDDLPYAKKNAYQGNGTSGLYVEMFLDGKYNGLYCFTDKIDRKKLNLKKYDTNADGSLSTQHGLLYKARTWTEPTCLFNYSDTVRTDTLYWDGWEQKYPDDAQSQAYWQPMKDLIAFCSPIINTDITAFQANIDKHVYFDNIIHYYMFVQAFSILDNSIKNSYASIRDIQDGQQVLLTQWDMDASLGRTAGGDTITQTAFCGPIYGRCGLFFRLIQYDLCNFRLKFHDCWNTLKVAQLSPSNFNSKVESYRDLFLSSGAWNREKARWPEAVGDIDLNEEISYMENFYANNCRIFEDFVKDFPQSEGSSPLTRTEDALKVASYNGQISVKCDAPNALVAVYSLSGQRMASSSNLPALLNVPSGIYLVRLTSPTATATCKVAVK